MATAVPTTRRWTKAEYHQMEMLGWFHDQRVELIEGEILEMPAPGHPHCISTDRTAEVLRNVFRSGCWVRMQMALDLGADSEPQPDVAVVAGARDTFTAHPTTALLVVEVSDSSLAYDRSQKASLYARAGILDYWIVNLNNRQLEVRRNPVADSTQPYGFTYADVMTLMETDTVSALAAPHAPIQVADLLP